MSGICPPNLNSFNNEGLYNYVCSALGGSSVGVEIKKADLLHILQEAAVLYFTKYPIHRYLVIPTVIDINAKVNMTEKDAGFMGVASVNAINKNRIEPDAYQSVFDRYPYDALNSGNLSLVADEQVFERMFSRVMGIDFDYRVEAAYKLEDGTPTTIPQQWVHFRGSAFRSYSISIEYLAYLGTSDVELLKYPFESQDWFRRYLVAKSKQLVGMVRRKFGGIPGVDGGSMQLDGETMFTEGREDERELRMELNEKRRQTPIVFA